MAVNIRKYVVRAGHLDDLVALGSPFVSLLAVLDAERGQAGANIATFGDALWWAMTTVTTVGLRRPVPRDFTQGRFRCEGGSPATCQAPTMNRNRKRSDAEARNEALTAAHLDGTINSMTQMQNAILGVESATKALRAVRATGNADLITEAQQGRSDADSMFTMTATAASMIRLERTAWEAEQALRATLTLGSRLNRATWVLAGSTGVLVLATLGLIWATFAAA